MFSWPNTIFRLKMFDAVNFVDPIKTYLFGEFKK